MTFVNGIVVISKSKGVREDILEVQEEKIFYFLCVRCESINY